MLKVYLVGKEDGLRSYMRNLIDWAGCGYEIIDEAPDGEIAFPVIQKMKPDIVIADYEMPYVDGLSLVKLIKADNPDTEVILVSDSKDYDFVMACLRGGVTDCLESNVSDGELLSVLYGISERITHKKNVHSIEAMYGSIVKENHLLEKNKLFQSVVTASMSVAMLIETGSRVDVDLSAVWYGLMLVNFNFGQKDLKSRTEEEVNKELDAIANEYNIVVFDRGMDGKAFIIKADARDDLEATQDSFIASIKRLFNSYDGIKYYGGIGGAINRLSKMPELYDNVIRSYYRSHLIDENIIIGSANNNDTSYTDVSGAKFRTISPTRIGREEFANFLKFGETEETDTYVSSMVKSLGDDAMSMDIIRLYVVMDVYVEVCDFLEKLRIPYNEVSTPDSGPEIFQSSEGAIKYIIRIIKKAMELRSYASNNKYEDIVEAVMKYIDENYADEKLSLNVLASYVNFSPNHLSMIFSQQTGKTFIKYLTDYRMNKAKELLRYTTKRSNEISIEVGYKDPHYFSYLFKKTQGMTPTQYRGSKSDN